MGSGIFYSYYYLGRTAGGLVMYLVFATPPDPNLLLGECVEFFLLSSLKKFSLSREILVTLLLPALALLRMPLALVQIWGQQGVRPACTNIARIYVPVFCSGGIIFFCIYLSCDRTGDSRYIWI